MIGHRACPRYMYVRVSHNVCPVFAHSSNLAPYGTRFDMYYIIYVSRTKVTKSSSDISVGRPLRIICVAAIVCASRLNQDLYLNNITEAHSAVFSLAQAYSPSCIPGPVQLARVLLGHPYHGTGSERQKGVLRHCVSVQILGAMLCYLHWCVAFSKLVTRYCLSFSCVLALAVLCVSNRRATKRVCQRKILKYRVAR